MSSNGIVLIYSWVRFYVKSIHLDYSANDFDRLHHLVIILLSLLVSVHIHCLKYLFCSFINYLQGHTILRCICNNPPHQLYHYDSSRCLFGFNVCLWLQRLQLSALVPLLLTTLIFTILHLLYLFWNVSRWSTWKNFHSISPQVIWKFYSALFYF